MSDDSKWRVLHHREVKKVDIPLLEKSGLKADFDDVIQILKENPYQRVRNMEILNPRQKQIDSMRINVKHRVVYTIDKKNKIVKIWSAWTHYQQRMPK
jgi:Txe/YoeB family toxin of toxin-antitoxin system